MKIRLRYGVAVATFLILLPVVAGSRAGLTRLATGYLWAEAELDAVRLADTAVQSTRHAMLSLTPAEVREVLAGIGRQKGVRSIRLYDGEGRLRHPAGVRTAPLDLAGKQCTACHADPRSLPAAAKACVHWNGGHLLLYHPVRNEPECSAGACHPSRERQPLLGVLELRTDGTPTAAKVEELQRHGLLWGAVVLAAAAVPLLLAFRWLVDRPLAECLRLVREVSKGDLSARSRLHPSNEWGELLGAFDSMVSALQGNRIVLEALNRDLEGQVIQRTRELEEALEAAQESDRMKTEFLANLSHEFSTPIQGVIGYAQLLLDGIDGPLSETQKDDVERILRSGRRLLDWVEDLLELARLDANRRFLCVDRVRVEELAEEAVDVGSAAAANKALDVVCEVQPGCPAVYGDVAALRRVFFHLVANAVRHTDEGRVAVTVEHPEPPWVDVRIEDTGPGIEPEILESSLRGFASKTGGGGLAVGIGLARRLVELHGGVFEVQSAPGEGTRIRIRLPVEASAGEAAAPS